MANDAARPPFLVSLVTNTEGPVCKIHRLDPADETVKTEGRAFVYRGKIEALSFDSLTDFIERRRNLDANQAFVFGKSKYPEATIVTQRALSRIPKARRCHEGIIARDRAHISWSDGPSIIMLDWDRPEEFPDEIRDRVPDTPEGIREFLVDLIPGLSGVPMAWAPSSSSCIYRDESMLKGVSGQRLYLVVASGLDIPRFKEALRYALIQRRLVWMKLSKSGKRLERYPFDLSVYQPERLDFAASPQCEPPLSWRPPDPIIWNDDGRYLSGADLPKVTKEERALADFHIEDLRQAIAAEAAEVAEAWIQDTGRQIAARQGIHDLNLATEVARAAIERGVLLSDFVLIDQDGERVTVGELLDDPNKNDGRRFHDPLEPDYRNDNRIAVFQVDGSGRARVYSHAHGGQWWRCSRKIVTVRIGLIDETVDRLRGALEQDTCDLYLSGDAIVAIDEVEGRMKPLDSDALALRLHRRFQVVGFDRKGNLVPKNLPTRHLKALMSDATALPLPRLNSVTRGPYARADGSVVDEPGYDPVCEVMYVSDFPTPPTVRQNVGLDEAREALHALLRPFSAFPFKSAVDRGALLAALLTAVLRQSIGTAPGFMFTATMAGTGKTTLAQSVGLFQVGRPVPVSALPREDDELRKHLFASLRQGQTYLLLDNAERGSELTSPVIANLITGPTFEGRVLGSSLVETRPNRLTVAFTGNNIAMRGDLNRRILTIALDAEVERPWEREFDFYPPAYIEANWHHLRVAALELIQGWRCAGSPPPPGAAGFPEWDNVVRGTICWLLDNVDAGVEIADPKDAIDLAYEDETESEELGLLLTAWFDLFGDQEVLAKDAIAEVYEADAVDLDLGGRAETDGDLRPQRRAFAEAYRLAVPQNGNGNAAPVLGRYLKSHEGVIVGDLRFERGGRSGGSRRWRVRQVKNGT